MEEGRYDLRTQIFKKRAQKAKFDKEEVYLCLKNITECCCVF
jgi:hypothetical protein